MLSMGGLASTTTSGVRAKEQIKYRVKDGAGGHEDYTVVVDASNEIFYVEED